MPTPLTTDSRRFFLSNLWGSPGCQSSASPLRLPASFGIDQDETAWFAADHWSPSNRLTLDLGLRFDNDTVTGATHVAPRAGFILALTNDGKTLLKGGVGMFYDRVPLIDPVFEHLPERTVSILDEDGEVSSATEYVNRIGGGLHNPESISWNAAIERQVVERLTIRAAYEQRNTTKDFTVSPISGAISSITLSNTGRDSYAALLAHDNAVL